jgi:alpha-L-fucosidase
MNPRAYTLTRGAFSLYITTLLACATSFAQTRSTVQNNSAASSTGRTNAAEGAAHDAKMAWWREARFGMFIHWGVYSVPAGRYQGKTIPGLGEWIMHDAKIPRAAYQQFAAQFNPVGYDPNAWVRLAKEAGVKYIVITSKHHDGFALFDSKASDWNVVKATPYGKDLLKPLAEACRKYGIKLGFYYSQANDWNNPGGAAAGGHWDSTQNGSMDEYIRNVAVPQVKEILTNYGDIAEIWWDVPTGMTKERAAQFLPLLALQSGIISNNRLGGGFHGDIETPEQYIPATGIPGKDWETCMTMNDTWGFKTDDQHWKSAETLIRNLVDIASKGGNYLLNVGPTDQGTFPGPIVDRLKAIGRWMKTNGEAIYGTSASPFTHLDWGRCTKKLYAGGATLYLHVFDWPKDGRLLLPGLRNEALSAALLDGGAVLRTEATSQGLVLRLPAHAPDSICSVIRLKVKGMLKVDVPVTAPKPPVSAAVQGPLILRAGQADLHLSSSGEGPAIEGQADSSNIGFWTDADGWISWTIKADNPVRYRVYALVSTPAQMSQLFLTLGGERLSTIVSGTDSYHHYEEEDLGSLSVTKAGTYTLSIHPAAGSWNPINLRWLRLEPVKAQ